MKEVDTKLQRTKMRTTNMDIRKMAMTGMLSAVSAVLMFLSFSVPFMPSFIKMDFSELPALIATFALGPISGVTVCFVKNLVNLTMSTTGGVGELCNFLLGASFVLPAGVIYAKMKNRKGALIGSLIGSILMAAMSVPINYYLVYPIYTKILPLEKMILAYQVILPGIHNLLQALLVFNMPFTFIKGICNVIIAFIIYKPLAPIIKGRY